MLICFCEHDGKAAMLLGLADDTIEFMKQGQPVMVYAGGNTPNLPTLILFSGASDESMLDLLKDKGLINKETPMETLRVQMEQPEMVQSEQKGATNVSDTGLFGSGGDGAEAEKHESIFRNQRHPLDRD